ncbi:hypothetical protein [Roseibium sp.]|uniref:hypothetical protein n=1 Tax=Roseibium sp. TaxID=1936156 RepID=UPI003264BC5B
MVTTNLSFWEKNFSYPNEPTPDPNPTHNIPGSTDDNSGGEVNDANSEALFPFMDGTSEETRLDSPTDGNGNEVDLETVALTGITSDFFNGLHSAHQLQLLDRFGGSLVLQEGTDARLDVVLAGDGRTVLTLQNLSKTDIATLSLADQTLIVDYLAGLGTGGGDVRATLASVWGVQLGDTVAANRSVATALIQAAIDDDIRPRKSANEDLFTDQLDNLKALVDRNALFSLADIQREVDAVKERFDRVATFEESIAPDHIVEGGEDEVYHGLNSTDNDATIVNGLKNFVAQEQRLLDLQNKRLEIAASSKSMDVPTLIAALQLTYNIEKEAEVAILTEEMQQQNALLKDYAEMQRIVNEALKHFSSGEDAAEETRDAEGSKDGTHVIWLPDKNVVPHEGDEGIPKDNSSLSTGERRVLIMFDDNYSGPYTFKSGHPIEKLHGITRPLDNIVSNVQAENTKDPYFVQQNLNKRSQSQWNIFSTQLADAVTLINQNSQILTNEISSMNQERNRHYDLANNALRRMNDILTSIARS